MLCKTSGVHRIPSRVITFRVSATEAYSLTDIILEFLCYDALNQRALHKCLSYSSNPLIQHLYGPQYTQLKTNSGDLASTDWRSQYSMMASSGFTQACFSSRYSYY